MIYKVLISPKANSFLNKLENKNKERIKEKLKSLSENPELGKPLVGRLSGLWSLPTGIIELYTKLGKMNCLS